MAQIQKKTTVRDMTQGSIMKQVVLFALPLMLGNVFQMLYNTVDSIVVGNFVGKEALAAVGSTTALVNIMVFFFNGFSVGAGVVIARHFGARNMQKLHISVETTMAATFAMCMLFTVGGVLAVKPMLRFMATPDDVFQDATTYLRIYIAGISGLLIYNMGSGILRAVGDTTRPLYFLVLTSVMNIVLDLVFVLGLKLGISGVSFATIISQFISAGLTLRLLSGTEDIYKLTWNDLKIDWDVLRQIFAVGLPTAIQSVLTSFSNAFVQSYINSFGSGVMAGWSTYNKLDQFVFLPIQSLSMAATTFVSQNLGAGQKERAAKGTFATVGFSLAVTAVIVTFVQIFAKTLVALFTSDEEVINLGAMFVATNSFFLLFNCINHVLAGALRGRGDSRAPMIIMLLTFVLMRQIYLFVLTRYISNTPRWVGFGYPVGWMFCCVIEIAYYFIRWHGKDA